MDCGGLGRGGFSAAAVAGSACPFVADDGCPLALGVDGRRGGAARTARDDGDGALPVRPPRPPVLARRPRGGVVVVVAVALPANALSASFSALFAAALAGFTAEASDSAGMRVERDARRSLRSSRARSKCDRGLPTLDENDDASEDA
jgi:hypothetical protein